MTEENSTCDRGGLPNKPPKHRDELLILNMIIPYRLVAWLFESAKEQLQPPSRTWQQLHKRTPE